MKFLCKIGLHKYNKQSDRNNMYFLRDEGNKSVCKVVYKCIYCGNEESHIVKFPKL